MGSLSSNGILTLKVSGMVLRVLLTFSRLPRLTLAPASFDIFVSVAIVMNTVSVFAVEPFVVIAV